MEYETFQPTESEQQAAYEYFEACKAMTTITEKKEVVKLALKEQILNGYLNPLEFYRQAKIAAECIDDLKKDPEVFEMAMTEIAKYGKEKPTVNGAVVTSSQRSVYDYESTGDPVWKELKQKLKDREKFLQNIPSGGVADPETGEMIMPPTIKISEFITVKI
jgi:hypothetical protein